MVKTFRQATVWLGLTRVPRVEQIWGSGGTTADSLQSKLDVLRLLDMPKQPLFTSPCLVYACGQTATGLS